MACTGILLTAGNRFRLLLVNSVLGLLQQAIVKLEADFPNPATWVGSAIFTSTRDIFGDLAGLRTTLLNKYQLSSISLITAQRVLLSLRKDLRGPQLRYWAALLSPERRLMLDIPHLRRRVGP